MLLCTCWFGVCAGNFDMHATCQRNGMCNVGCAPLVQCLSDVWCGVGVTPCNGCMLRRVGVHACATAISDAATLLITTGMKPH